MIRRQRRHKYSQPAADDRESWLTRVIWTREEHPLFERLLIGGAVLCAAIEIVYQVGVAIQSAAYIAAHAPTP